MPDIVIFAYGVFTSLLLTAGVIFSIVELRAMGRKAEKYSPEQSEESDMRSDKQGVRT